MWMSWHGHGYLTLLGKIQLYHKEWAMGPSVVILEEQSVWLFMRKATVIHWIKCYFNWIILCQEEKTIKNQSTRYHTWLEREDSVKSGQEQLFTTKLRVKKPINQTRTKGIPGGNRTNRKYSSWKWRTVQSRVEGLEDIIPKLIWSSSVLSTTVKKAPPPSLNCSKSKKKVLVKVPRYYEGVSVLKKPKLYPTYYGREHATDVMQPQI